MGFDRIALDFRNIDVLGPSFSALPARIAFKHLRYAVHQGAVIMRDDAKKNAPKRTGKLRASIRIKEAEITKGKLVVGTRIATFRGGVKGKTIAGGYYAPLVERGHATRYKDGKGGKIKYIGPRPFMRPAFHNNRQRVIEVIALRLRERIGQEFAKGKK